MGFTALLQSNRQYPVHFYRDSNSHSPETAPRWQRHAPTSLAPEQVGADKSLTAAALRCRDKVKPEAQSAGGPMSHRAALSCLAPAVPCQAVTQDREMLIIICMK